MIARGPETFRAKLDIDAQVLHEVETIDLEQRRVWVRDLQSGAARWESFDQLLIATGARPIPLDMPGAGARGIYPVDSLQSGIELRQAVDTEKPRRAVIVGGGYIGLEMAEGLLLRGLEVSLVQRAPQMMTTLDPDMAAPIAERLRERGVRLYLGEALQGFETADGMVRAAVTTERTLPTDLVVLGMGVRPEVALAEEAGVPLGQTGAIRVNERMQTEVEGVWAAGDCVETFHLVSRRPFYVALGTVANKQGRVAGVNLGGQYATFPGVVGTAITKFFELEIARTGLQERELDEQGWSYETATIESRTHAHYYPGAEPMTVKILAEKGTGRLLGGQIVGGSGAGKRIDILATALHANLTVEEVMNLDLAYAPPFGMAWDPVLLAARKMVRTL